MVTRYDPPSGPFDVFLVAGQSNCLLGHGMDRAIDVSGGRVYQWGRTDPTEPNYGGLVSAPIVIGNEPLMHKARTTPFSGSDYIGFALTLMRNYYVPNVLAIGRSVLLVPCALGGTGFVTNEWNPGNALCQEAISRTNAAIAAGSGSSLVAVLWHQGENEAGFGTVTPWTQSQYAIALDALIAHFRASITGATTSPVVVGGLAPGWVAANTTDRQGVQNALIATPGRVSNTAYADPATPSNIQSGSDIHYSASEQRAFAGRWWTALDSLI